MNNFSSYLNTYIDYKSYTEPNVGHIQEILSLWLGKFRDLCIGALGARLESKLDNAYKGGAGPGVRK